MNFFDPPQILTTIYIQYVFIYIEIYTTGLFQTGLDCIACPHNTFKSAICMLDNSLWNVLKNI